MQCLGNELVYETPFEVAAIYSLLPIYSTLLNYSISCSRNSYCIEFPGASRSEMVTMSIRSIRSTCVNLGFVVVTVGGYSKVDHRHFTSNSRFDPSSSIPTPVCRMKLNVLRPQLISELQKLILCRSHILPTAVKSSSKSKMSVVCAHSWTRE